MKRVWLHIGMHKTGTTSVQRTFEKNPGLDGWKYLTVGGSRNMGGALFAMFSSNPHRYHWFVRRGDTPEKIAAEGVKLRAELAEAIQACPEQNLIISGESLSLIDGKGIYRLRRFLRKLCDDIQVIGYVRAPSAFKMSFFQQRVKHSDSPFDFTDFSACYRSRFKKFDVVFGRENVHLKKFDPASFRDACVVSDFCDTIGFEMADGFLVHRMNDSLSREACSLLFAYRRFGGDRGVGWDVIKEGNQVVNPLIRMPGTRFKVSSSHLALNPQEEKDRIWMEDRLGASLQEALSDDGSEITSEEDLLRIDRASCLAFAETFKDYHGITVPSALIPQGNPVDPRKAAEFLDACRQLWRERTVRRKERGQQPWRKRPHFLTRCWKYLIRTPGRILRSVK